MLAWELNRVAIIVIVIVVLAVAGTQLPALVRTFTERHYRRQDSHAPAAEHAGTDEPGERTPQDGRGASPRDGVGRAGPDEGDEGSPPMQQSG
jgi:hypothetical protein